MLEKTNLYLQVTEKNIKSTYYVYNPRICTQKEATSERILIGYQRLEVLALHRHLSGGNANFICCSHAPLQTVPKTTAVAGPITGTNKF